MFTSQSHRRSALAVAYLLFSVVLLASVTNAGADNITYNIVDQPQYETDLQTGGTDSISGTIITDGVIGPITWSDIVGGTFTYTSSLGVQTVPLIPNYTFSMQGYLAATDTQLLFPPQPASVNAYLAIHDPRNDSPPFTPGEFLGLSGGYWRQEDPPFDDFTFGDDEATGTSTAAPLSHFAYSSDSDPDPLGGNDPWVIATAQPTPEPSTLALLGSALLGLGVVYLRRRRTKGSGVGG